MRITVGMGSCGMAAGASDVYKLLPGAIPVGCIGMCYLEPVVSIDDCLYVRVDGRGAHELAKLTEGAENNADAYKISDDDLAVLSAQTRIALANCGVINPECIDEYLSKNGYEAARKAAFMTPDDIIAELKTSAIGGRGGAGFPTWFKWNAAKEAPSDKKYIICNADEGDPGAFMDRALLEGDPHSVLEGMLIAGMTIGANEGIIYVRAEYPLAIARLETAIRQARENKFIGVNTFNSGHSFDVVIKAGAGAFVCGEETALIASLEGERGMPRLKPPFPAERGFRGFPSNINNVETYANIPWIIRNGGSEFAKLGTDSSKGTKVFALTGKIARGGLAEVPMGCTINDVVFGVGGGIRDGKAFKAVQMGGPSGGCVPAELGSTVIDYKALAATGAIMGSGGMVVMDDDTCMVDMARFFLDFTCKESCGKCTHCRIGNRRMLELLTAVCEGKGRDGDIERLEELAAGVARGSLCALGQTAPNPVLTTLKYFRSEYESHINDKKCPAKQCKALLNYHIDVSICTGCTLCARKCPANAITGDLKRPHHIDSNLCIKCNKCTELCKFKAIEVN